MGLLVPQNIGKVTRVGVGAKLALVMFVLMCAMGGAGYWYYTDTQERIQILQKIMLN